MYVNRFSTRHLIGFGGLAADVKIHMYLNQKVTLLPGVLACAFHVSTEGNIYGVYIAGYINLASEDINYKQYHMHK